MFVKNNCIIIQYCKLDYQQAYRLALFLQAFSDVSHLDLVLFAKVDAPEMPTNKLTGYKSVQFVRGKRDLTGWPVGCNALWKDVMDWLLCSRQFENWNYVFTIEADCCPLTKDWTKLFDMCTGQVCGNGNLATTKYGDVWHINGNMFVKMNYNFLNWMYYQGVQQEAWDVHYVHHFARFEGGNQDLSKYMLNVYNSKDLKESDYRYYLSVGGVWLHGCKDGSLMRLVMAANGIQFEFEELPVPARSQLAKSPHILLVQDELNEYRVAHTGSELDCIKKRKQLKYKTYQIVDSKLFRK